MSADVSRVIDLNDNLTEITFNQGRPIIDADLSEPLQQLLANQAWLLRNAKPSLPKLEPEDGYIVLKEGHVDLGKGLVPFTIREKLFVEYLKEAEPELRLSPFRQKALQVIPAPSEGDERQVVLEIREREEFADSTQRREPYTARLRATTKRRYFYRLFLQNATQASNSVGLPLLGVSIPQTSQKKNPHGVLRIAIHKLPEKDAPDHWMVKVSNNNAASRFRIVDSAAGDRIRVDMVGRDPSELPVQGDFLEIRSTSSSDSILRKVDTVQSGDGSITLKRLDDDDQAKDIDVSQGAELIVWRMIQQWKPVELQRTAIDFNAREFVPVNEHNKDNEWDAIIVVGPTGEPDPHGIANEAEWSSKCFYQLDHERVASMRLTQPRLKRISWTIKYDMEGKVETIKPDVVASVDDRSKDGSLANHGSTKPIANSSRQNSHPLRTLNPNTPAPTILPEPETVAVRQWFASAMLEEVVGVDFSALRKKVLKDLPDGEYDLAAIEEDLQRLLSHARDIRLTS